MTAVTKVAIPTSAAARLPESSRLWPAVSVADDASIPFAGTNVVAASEIHAEIESLVQCLERTTKCDLYNILPMLKFKLFAIEIKDEQANC